MIYSLLVVHFLCDRLSQNHAGRYLKNMLAAHVDAYKAMKALPGGDRARVGLVVHDMTFVPRRRWYMHSR